MKKNKFDYVIVGAGVAAAAVSKGILEKNHEASILILEAGPEIKAKDRRFWWDYITRGERPYTFTYDQVWEAPNTGNTPYLTAGVRVKAYGGSTMHWGGWCLRYKPEDFEMRTRTGEGADWPISYKDLEPYYQMGEEFLSVCGDHTEGWIEGAPPYPAPPFQWTAPDGDMLEAWENLDVVYQDGDEKGPKIKVKSGKMPIARYRKCMTTGTCKYCPIGGRFNAQYVLDDLKYDSRFKKLEIRINSPVNRVNMSSKSKAESVTYIENTTGQEHTVYGDTIIIASGTYNVPKLLRASKSEYWENGIGNDTDLVGRFVVSHSLLEVNGIADENPNGYYQEYDFPTLMSRSYDTPEHQKKGKIFMFKNRKYPNVDLAQLMIEGKTREEIDDIVYGKMQIQIQAFYEEKGKYENRLEAKTDENGNVLFDRFGLPQTVVNFNRTDKDRKDTEDRLEILKGVIKEMGLRIPEGEGEALVPGGKKVFGAKVQNPGGHHSTSTARMGTDKTNSVTDKHMRVHETENLYVCSNAAFPTCSAVNPTLTLTAMSFRLVDHLISKTK